MFEMTLKQVAAVHSKELERLIEEAGSIAHLAKMIGYEVNTVQSWAYRGRISKNGAEVVAQHKELGKSFTVAILRPEIGQQL